MTREAIKEAALRMVESGGLINLSRSGLCNEVGLPDGSFPHVMGCNFSEFVQELIEEGVTSPTHPVNKARTDPELRKAHILEVALGVAKDLGYLQLTRKRVSKAAHISESLIGYYFPLMADLRREVMAQAIRREIPEIVAQGLAARDEVARNAPSELRQKAADILMQQ